MIKYSIIIPVYNVERYLADCLDSVLNQTEIDDEYEVICIDDKSTDNSLMILEKYKEDYNITVIKHDVNQGLSSTRNTGIKYANGEYIWFIDSDDWISDDSLKIIDESIPDKGLDILVFDIEAILEDGFQYQTTRSIECGSFDGIYNGRDYFVKSMNRKQAKVEACRHVYRKSFIEKNNLYFVSGVLHEDNLFFFQTTMLAESIKEVDANIYFYRKHSGSIMGTHDGKRAESYFIIIQRIMAWMVNHEGELEDRLQIAIAEFVLTLRDSFIREKSYCSSDYEPSVGNAYNRMLFKAQIANDEYKYAQLKPDEIETIKQYKGIVVYGAGNCARETIQLLKINGVVPDCVVVTSMDNNPQMVCGIRVIPLAEAQLDRENTVIVISILKKYCEGVREMLEDNGYWHIVYSAK